MIYTLDLTNYFNCLVLRNFKNFLFIYTLEILWENI